MSDHNLGDPPLRLLTAFQEACQKEPDYLLKLQDREIWVAADVGTGIYQTIIVPDLNARTCFDRRSAKRRKGRNNRPLPVWSLYMAGALTMLERRGLTLQGARVVMAGSEPKGARYQHALGMAFAALWHHVCDVPFTTATLIAIMDDVQQDYL